MGTLWFPRRRGLVKGIVNIPKGLLLLVTRLRKNIVDKVSNIFESPIFYDDYDFDVTLFEKECYKIKNSDQKGRFLSNVGGWQSNDFIEGNSLFKDLQDKIKESANYFADSIEMDKVNLGNFWININQKKDSNIIHTHPFSIFSGVFYIKTPENSGNLIFKHPASDILERDWFFHRRKSMNSVNSLTWVLQAIPNRIYIFPSWLLHCVTPNMSDDDRISLSFNLITA